MDDLQVDQTSAASKAMKGAVHCFCVMLLVLFTFGCSGAQKPPIAKGDSRLVTREFLVRGNMEKWGYGAYSYLLMPRAPRTDERYVALLTAYLGLPSDRPASAGEQVTSLARRNITYVPVNQEPQQEVTQVTWLIENYDVARAAAILHSQGLNDIGPYIVTYSAPLSPEQSQVDVAVLDLSSVPRESMLAWLDYFVRVSQEPDDWGHRGAELMLLRLHDMMANLQPPLEVTIKAIQPIGKIVKAFALTN